MSKGYVNVQQLITKSDISLGDSVLQTECVIPFCGNRSSVAAPYEDYAVYLCLCGNHKDILNPEMFKTIVFDKNPNDKRWEA